MIETSKRSIHNDASRTKASRRYGTSSFWAMLYKLKEKKVACRGMAGTADVSCTGCGVGKTACAGTAGFAIAAEGGSD
jgi:hypothetical protein